MFLLTLITLILAPASTAGAISLEREKQTLDLLDHDADLVARDRARQARVRACPGSCCCCSRRSRSSALVFTFGGVAPDDVLRAYVILLVTAFAFGAIGLFVSALVKRTQAATVINLVAVIVLTAGTAFIFLFWTAMTGNSGFLPDEPTRDENPIESLTQPPARGPACGSTRSSPRSTSMCGTETGLRRRRARSSPRVTNARPTPSTATVDGGFGVARDSYWPRSVARDDDRRRSS